MSESQLTATLDSASVAAAQPWRALPYAVAPLDLQLLELAAAPDVSASRGGTWRADVSTPSRGLVVVDLLAPAAIAAAAEAKVAVAVAAGLLTVTVTSVGADTAAARRAKAGGGGGGVPAVVRSGSFSMQLPEGVQEGQPQAMKISRQLGMISMRIQLTETVSE